MAKSKLPTPEPLFSRWLAPTPTVVIILAWLLLIAHAYWGKLILLPSVWEDMASTLTAALWKNALNLAVKLAWLASLWFLAAAVGAACSRLLRLKGSRLEAWLLASALGFGTLSLILLGLAAGGWFSPHFLKTLFLVSVAAAMAAAPWWNHWLPRESPGPSRRLTPVEIAALAGIAAAILLQALGALAPEVFYDSLLYHLALPKLYLLNGRLIGVPQNLYSGLPAALQMLYGLILSLTDDRLASLWHASTGWAAAAAIYALGKRLVSRSAGIFAAFAVMTMPLTIYTGWACGVDLGAAFFFSAGALALLRWSSRQEESQSDLIAAGLLLGFSCGTKYNVLPFACLLVLLHAWQTRRFGSPWRSTAILAAAMAVALSPFLVKNIVFFHNPVYPFLRGLFGDPGWICDWASFLSAAGSRHPFSEWREILLQPWITSTGSWPKGDWPGPVYLILLPWLFLLRPRRHEARSLLVAAAGCYALWALSTSLVRFLLPASGLLALGAAIALENGSLPRWLRRIGWLAALYAGAFNLQLSFQLGEQIGQWQFLEGRISRSDYLKTPRHTYGLPYYAAADFINRELPPEAKVLVLGESRTYYIERDCLSASVYDRHPFWTEVQQAKDGTDLLERLRRRGVTHLFLNAQLFILRPDSPGIFPREAARSPALADFWAHHLSPLFEDRDDGGANPRWLLVYKLVDQTKAPTPNPVLPVLELLKQRGQA